MSVDEAYGGGTLTHGAGYALYRAVPDIAGGEDPGDAAL
jgi:hypothetical protein